jgi:hypothetical protein
MAMLKFEDYRNRYGTIKIEREDGSIPHFELLLEARSLGGNVPESGIVAYRLVP